jgi:ADP-ribosylglycohydrolase
MTASFADRVTGSIVGLAIGDALGFPHEFRSVDQIRREIGPSGITDFLPVKDPRFTRPFILGPAHPPGTFTDDTQMSLCVAESLMACGYRPLDELLDEMSRRFVNWCFSEENNRCPGEATCTACEKLRSGLSWKDSAVTGSKGAGANMRVIPVGLFFDELDRVYEVARAQAEITHRHPAALEAAAATALTAALLLRGATFDELLAEVRRRCRGKDPDFDEIDDRFDRATKREPQEVLIKRGRSGVALGEGWVAEEAYFSALYCATRAPDSFSGAVLLAVNTDGDSDTIATLVGGFMGARLGLGAIPLHWRIEVERSEMLHEVGRRLPSYRMAGHSPE